MGRTSTSPGGTTATSSPTSCGRTAATTRTCSSPGSNRVGEGRAPVLPILPILPIHGEVAPPGAGGAGGGAARRRRGGRWRRQGPGGEQGRAQGAERAPGLLYVGRGAALFPPGSKRARGGRGGKHGRPRPPAGRRVVGVGSAHRRVQHAARDVGDHELRLVLADL